MFRCSKDTLLVWTLRGLAATSGVIVLLILAFLLGESRPALRQVGLARFCTDPSWHPAAIADEGTFRIWPLLAGTLAAAIGAVLLAAPLGILSAVFAQFYAPAWLARWYGRMIELMAGVPSVVYGLWGLVVLVPLVAKWEPPGASLFTGIVILKLMILPTVALVADAALAAVPRELHLAAAALGLPRTSTVFRIVLPAARSGLVTAVILALARAIGETMAVLMVCGNVVRMPTSLFDSVRTLTATIALEMGYARGDHRAALFVCGLVLLLCVALLVAVAEVFSRGRLLPGGKLRGTN